jgi:hypothetical protein
MVTKTFSPLDALDELNATAKKLRAQSRYKKYSKGMKSAFKNRAFGIETAVKIIQRYAVYLEDESVSEEHESIYANIKEPQQ